MRKYLVFCSAASLKNLTPELFGAEREFDVCIHDYSLHQLALNPEVAEPEYYSWQAGEKLNVAASIIPTLSTYRQFAFLDDDVVVSTYNLNRLFRAGDALGLSIYQPALTCNSFGSHNHLFQHLNSGIRKVPFVEIMCPFFSAEALDLCLPTFDINESGWGLDIYLWPKIVSGETYVIDSIPVGHYREPARRNRVLRNGLTCQQELWIQQVIDNPARASTLPPGEWLPTPMEDPL